MCMMKHCCVFANKIEFGAKAWLGYCAPLQCDLAPGATDHASMSEGSRCDTACFKQAVSQRGQG